MSELNLSSYKLQDAALTASIALPNGAGIVYTAGIKLEVPPQLGEYEAELSMPALTSTQMPSATTYSVEFQDSADDSSYTTLFTLPLVTSSSGIAAAVTRLGLNSAWRKYIRAKITLANGGGTAGDCRASSASMYLVF